MALEKFIEGASEVLFRFYDVRCRPIQVKVDDQSRRRNEYLGEPEETRNRAASHTLLSVLKTKLSSECFNRISELLSDVGRSPCRFQDFGTSNSKTTERSCLLFYELCCYTLGSKERVDATRLLYKILDDCIKINSRYTNISSGSRAEGVDIPGGDYDLMTILEQINVDVEGSQFDETKPFLFLNTENTYPGFAHLMVPKNRFSNELLSLWGEETNYGALVCNKRFKEYFMSKYRATDAIIHGPCISTKSGSVDHLFCFRCKTWPETARQWVYRLRSQNWPSNDLVAEIIEQGILLVPIGSKFGAKDDCCIEWRLSFSLSEKSLIHSFNHTQFLTYTGIKSIQKLYLRKIIGGNTLCSYFFKTTLFWMCEEAPVSFWNPSNSFLCLREFQRGLLYWVKYGFCPHYFIPENNLFEGIMDIESKKQAEHILINFLALLLHQHSHNHFYLFFDAPRVDGFHKHKTSKDYKSEKTKGILRSLTVMRSSLRVCTFNQIKAIMIKSLYRLLTQKLSYFPKGLYLLSFCYANQTFSQMISLNILNNNKQTYVYRKNVLSHLLLGTQADAVAGWLLISMFWYNTDQLEFVLLIIDFVLQKAKGDRMFFSIINDHLPKYLDFEPQNERNYRRSFLKHMNTSFLDLMYLHPNPAWCLDCLNDLFKDEGIEFSKMPSLIFAHFLRFLCFFKTRDMTRTDQALRDIITTNRKSRYPEDLQGRIIGYGILSRSYKLIGDHRAASYWRNHLKRFRMQTYG